MTVTLSLIAFSLVGNVMNVISGEWAESMSGIGAGIDSFYEYLLKVSNSL